MKIAIVGAGISGLSTYLFLKKHLPNPPRPDSPHEIIVYDSYPSLSRKQRESAIYLSQADGASFIGGGLGVAANGLATLKVLDPDIHDDCVAKGYPAVRFQMKNAHDWTLGSMPAIDPKNQSEPMLMIRRQQVWDCIRDKVPDEALSCGKAVSKIGQGQSGKAVLHFADGSISDEKDLVIGADGVKSNVKKAVLGDGDKDEYPARYEGLFGVGGFMPSSKLPPLPEDRVLKAPHSPSVMTFGPNGFFGYSPCTTAPGNVLTTATTVKDLHLPFGPEAFWWSTYERPELPDVKAVDKDDVVRQLRERHQAWADPVIQQIIAEPEEVGLVPTWVMPKIPTWTKALPSTSGQGVSVALEDTHALSLLLGHYLPAIYASSTPPGPAAEQEALETAMAKYVAIRKPRVERILDFALRMGDRKRKQSFVGEWTTYLMMWAICKLHPDFMLKVLEHSVTDEVDKVIKEGDNV